MFVIPHCQLVLTLVVNLGRQSKSRKRKLKNELVLLRELMAVTLFAVDWSSERELMIVTLFLVCGVVFRTRRISNIELCESPSHYLSLYSSHSPVFSSCANLCRASSLCVRKCNFVSGSEDSEREACRTNARTQGKLVFCSPPLPSTDNRERIMLSEGEMSTPFSILLTTKRRRTYTFMFCFQKKKKADNAERRRNIRASYIVVVHAILDSPDNKQTANTH